MLSIEGFNQYIVWRSAPRADGKTDKWVVHPTAGYRTDPTDPACWLSRDAALAAVAAGVGHGIGFVFTAADPFFFFDIDNAWDGTMWSDLATAALSAFQGCYVEVSQSGTGLHVIGSALPGEHRCRNQQLGIELYTEGRFCALTGTHATGSAAHMAQPAYDWLVASYFAPTDGPDAADWSDGPCAEWIGPEDDDELLERMLASRPSAGGVFGGKATVRQLWEADVDALGAVWPDARGFDHSSADAALCAHLAFWTGKDCERMDRLFRRSGLYRDKWDRGGTKPYNVETITKALAYCTNVYRQPAPVGTSGPPAPAAPPPPADLQPTADGIRRGYQYMGVAEQVAWFTGCCYVQDIHRMLTPDGSLLKPEQFDSSTYGGYVFGLDTIGDKTTRSAWTAYTQSQGYNFPKAHSCCFRPEIAPGAIVEEEGWRLINTYVPIETPALPGDPSPMLDHIARMLPDPDDRAVLIAYMAAVVQFPGRKFMWAPLIQGTKGNGKSLLGKVLAYAVGSRYTAMPDPDDISNKFNAWILNMQLVIIDEAYVADRRDMENTLKRLITNDRIAIQGKGKDQVTGDNRANFMLNSNYRTAVRIDDEERRYAPFFTAQQERDDLERDGMVGEYFPRLVQWLQADGYAIMNHYLRTYQIPDALNPSLMARAPQTSSTREAVTASRGVIEQEVIEAIEQSRPGFAGGWVSSLALDRLLEERKAAGKLPRANRREFMRGLGYDWHPALRDGRVNNPIPCPAGHGKPVLYCKRGSLQAQLQTQDEVVKHYLAAQQGSTLAAQVFAGAAATTHPALTGQ